MNATTFIPSKAIDALTWLVAKHGYGWFTYTRDFRGISNIRIALPPPDSTVNRASYEFLRRWIVACEMASRLHMQSAAELVTIYTSARILKDGPKVFFPTDEQCEAMLNVSIDIPKTYYRQPYPIFIVYLQPSFVERHAARAENKRFPRWTSVTESDDKKTLWIGSHYDGWDGMVNITSLHTPGTIEEAIASRNVVIGPESEYTDNEACQRLMLNFAMMLTNFNHLLQYKNPDEAEAIARRFLKTTDPIVKKSLSDRKRWLVQEIVPEQSTRFYDEAREEPGPELGGSHASPRPHWRRGHWRREAGYREILAAGKKPRITFIRPVLVNGHLIEGGEIPAFSVGYNDPSRGGQSLPMP
jgi:hypothetical protein